MYSGLKVMRSNAGYYLGRSDEDGIPYSRESKYYPTFESAEKDLKEGFDVRDCAENNSAYEKKVLPDIRKKKKKSHIYIQTVKKYEKEMNMVKTIIDKGFKLSVGFGMFKCKNCNNYSAFKFLKNRSTMYACNLCGTRWGSLIKP